MSAKFGQFANEDDGWQELEGRRPWDTYFYGGMNALAAEQRCRRPHERFSALPGVTTLGLSRTQVDRHYQFQITCNNRESTVISLSELETELDDCLSSPCRHVVLDLTSLELDTLLYLLPFLVSRGVKDLMAVYLVPDDYLNHERGLEYQEIQQPRGYVSFRAGLAGERDAAHYFLLGFDRGRATRFIEQYDWDWSRVHALVGDPSYIQKSGRDGVDIALDSNDDWLEKICPGNLHRIPAHDPSSVREFFINQLREFPCIDVIPLGPKPMLLGLLLFYWPLPEEQRARIRLLYDFPTPKEGCTQGIAKGFWFDCGELLT